MTEQRPDEHQAQFVYSREPRDFIEKLFMGKERRRNLQSAGIFASHCSPGASTGLTGTTS